MTEPETKWPQRIRADPNQFISGEYSLANVQTYISEQEHSALLEEAVNAETAPETKWPRMWISPEFVGKGCYRPVLTGWTNYYDERVETEVYLSMSEHEALLEEAVNAETARRLMIGLEQAREARAEARLEGAYIQQQIECAKRAITNGDPGLAAFALRDLNISKELGIDGLFSCLASENGFPHENDLKPLIERIQDHLKKAARGANEI